MPRDLDSLVNKLRLFAPQRPVVLNAPPGYVDRLVLATGRAIPTRVAGLHDWIQLFAQDRGALEAGLPAAAGALDDPGLLWIAYPKAASRIQTDLTRDKGWEAVAAADLMWLGLVAIDETWSAFSLRRYRPGEDRQAFR